jgi:hypothetical protein
MATPNASAEASLSVAEIIDGLRNLSAADIIKFKKGSQYLSYGGARPPEDLRNEAVRRAAAGTRRCPRGLPIVVFLFGAMRSIAWSDRRTLRRGPKLTIVPKEHSAGASAFGGVDPRLSPEERMILTQELAETKRKILALFEDDALAHLLAEGMIDEMEGQELRELVGLNEKEFASKRRFVRRRIEKAYPNGLVS